MILEHELRISQLLAEGYIESRSGASAVITNSLSDQFLSMRPAVASVVNHPGSESISSFAPLPGGAGHRGSPVWVPSVFGRSGVTHAARKVREFHELCGPDGIRIAPPRFRMCRPGR